MILGLGIDLVEISRVERILGGRPELAARFLARCFTEGERRYCEARGAGRAASYAARFAAKEAVMKALSAPAGLRFTDVEVTRPGGRPEVALRGAAERAASALGVRRVHLALTHDAGTAAASVVLEGEGR
ncbi:holo-ACP synthase [Anaeromyxobacter paludicola]|uniref:Holo-[acyl-carrier-protein] synthase n=1 Tax=Anaeromyxobacter paludicola TaxID=2918171 RepID=A0ABN6N6S3_9BACT|nr:holo-ACP synthase [Anaeromyxobacter paludicola]BDG07848.1 holo-[acyl-carrier-protein] synthase [Anaeromyxobacter paludicola]